MIGSSQIAGAQAAGVDLDIPLPGVAVEDVTVIGPSEAKVIADVDPNGLATNVFVEYGANGVLSLRTPKVGIGASLDPTRFVAELLNLEPGTSYSYRVVAESAGGTTSGPLLTFNTPLTSSLQEPLVVSLSTGSPTTVGAKGVSKSARCTITGTNRNDVLKGTSRRDVICGLRGNDRILGRGGNDLIIGGTGKDRVFGGKGRDRLLGNAGRDRLNARDGKRGDRVDGGKGRDKVFADKGDRVLASESVSRR